MKRIIVIGCCGAGKSTLSTRLHKILKLPLIHLDQEYWKSGWIETSKDEWEKIARSLANQESWIIDGNYGGTIDIRLDRADTVIFLSVPTYKAMYRVITRTLKYWGKTRPDMTKGCNERFDLEFLHYVLTFNLRNRKDLLKKLEALDASKSVHILKNNHEIEQFLTAHIRSKV